MKHDEDSLLIAPFITCFDGEDGDKKDDDKGGDDKPTISQKKMNAILADEKHKAQKRVDDALAELDAIKSRTKLTDKERKELEERVEQMRQEGQTKEQLALDAQAKLEKKMKKETEDLSKDRDSWRGRFEKSTIENALISAAAEHKAYDSEQILELLRSSTQLVEDTDTDGKSVGSFSPKVTLKTKDEAGKDITLVLNAKDAVKKMSEMDRYANLFKGNGVGGIQRFPSGGPGAKDLVALAKDPAAYRQAKKDGKLPTR